MDKSTVFRALYVVAWPIWAGGYPTQQQALNAFEVHRKHLTVAIGDRLQSLLGATFSLAELHCQIGTHSPVSGLWPRDYVPNSINVVVVVNAPASSLQPSGNLTSKVADAVEDIGGVLSTFSLTYLPGAKEGANIYDVTSRWDAGPALSYAESGEPLQHVAESSPVVTGLPTDPGRQRTRVFISYSHRDARWLSRLQAHLMPLARDFGIDLWDDTKIKSGMNWRQAINDAMQTAKVAILLVSADFLASEFIVKNELPPLLAAASNEGTLILPVILSPSMFLHLPSLSQYQTVNDPATPLMSMPKGKQEKVLNDIAVRVRSHFSS